MEKVKLVVALPAGFEVTDALLKKSSVIPHGQAATIHCFFRGTLRGFRSGEILTSEMEADVLVYDMLTNQHPDNGRDEQYWQWEPGNFGFGDYYLLMLDVPFENCLIGYLGKSIGEQPYDKLHDLKGYGWDIGLSEIRSEWVSQVRLGLAMGQVLYTIDPQLYAGYMHLSNGKSVLHEMPSTTRSMDNAMMAETKPGKPFWEICEHAANPTSEDPVWLQGNSQAAGSAAGNSRTSVF